MIKGEIIYTSNIAEFGKVIAKQIILLAIRCIDSNNQFVMAVPGGSTPIPVFNTFTQKKYQKVIDWSKVHIFWVDERCVPANHEDNNFKLCFDVWLNSCPKIQYHRIRGWLDPKSEAIKYENEIRKLLHNKNNIPSFDLIFLGVGEDGHVASLFPNSSLIGEKEKLVADTYVHFFNTTRITMTLPLLNNAKNRVIGIIGGKKKKIFAEIMNSQLNDYPLINLLSAGSKDMWVIN